MAKMLVYGYWPIGRHSVEWQGKVKVVDKVIVGFYDPVANTTYTKFYTLSKFPKSNMVKELGVVTIADAVGIAVEAATKTVGDYFRITTVARLDVPKVDIKQFGEIKEPTRLIEAMKSRAVS